MPSLSELAFELKNNPALAETLGFSAWLPPPPIERFSLFLRDTRNETFQVLRHLIVDRLTEERVISGKVVAIDSRAIEANVRENNLKTAVTHCFDKKRRPKGDPDAQLGIKIYSLKPFQGKITFFWGYRNHILTDAHLELPLHENTLPADHDEKKQALPLLQQLMSLFQLSCEAVVADANSDIEGLLSYIFYKMKAKPVIPKNPRGPQRDDFQVKKNPILCPGNLEMHMRGKMTTRGRTYLQYSCPLYYGRL